MAHFYADIIGSKGKTSRLGSKASGIKARIASWNGAVFVHLYHKDGKDSANITLEPWEGTGVRKLLFSGEL